jgi:hypothetical protein
VHFVLEMRRAGSEGVDAGGGLQSGLDLMRCCKGVAVLPVRTLLRGAGAAGMGGRCFEGVLPWPSVRDEDLRGATRQRPAWTLRDLSQA